MAEVVVINATEERVRVSEKEGKRVSLIHVKFGNSISGRASIHTHTIQSKSPCKPHASLQSTSSSSSFAAAFLQFTFTAYILYYIDYIWFEIDRYAYLIHGIIGQLVMAVGCKRLHFLCARADEAICCSFYWNCVRAIALYGIAAMIAIMIALRSLCWELLRLLWGRKRERADQDRSFKLGEWELDVWSPNSNHFGFTDLTNTQFERSFYDDHWLT